MTVLAPFAEFGQVRAFPTFLARQGIAAAWIDGCAQTCYISPALKEVLDPASFSNDVSSVPVVAVPTLFGLYDELGVRRLTAEELPLVQAQETGLLHEAIIAAKGNQQPLRRFKWTAVPMPSTHSAGQAALAVVTEASGQASQSGCTELRESLMQTLNHELRTPLTTILGYVEVLAEQSEDLPYSVVHAVDAIHRAGLRLSRLAEELSTMGEVDCDDR